MKKKFVSWLSIAILLCSLIPSSVLAYDGESGDEASLICQEIGFLP